ncbi:MAG TPA: hypothetical protein VLA34_03615 [Candidatus Krumholzibacterium sp.]|nr:hypothetical protein [Candidatus Krumholzibacterium sp.]
MKTHTDYLDAVGSMIRRMLEGRISPLSFLLIVGFFSSLVMLYISLHVHFQALSGDINRNVTLKDRLIEEKSYLTAEHDMLSSPERIIPLVREYGLVAGGSDDIKRVAYYNSFKMFRKEAAWWARAATDGSGDGMPLGSPEN